jgi:Bacterial conjugation TrbI-like protein
LKKRSSARLLALSFTLLLAGAPAQVFAADSDLNFKIYSPETSSTTESTTTGAKPDSASVSDQSSILDSATTTDTPLKEPMSPTSSTSTTTTESATTSAAPPKPTAKEDEATSTLMQETPVSDSKASSKPAEETTTDTATLRAEKPVAEATPDKAPDTTTASTDKAADTTASTDKAADTTASTDKAADTTASTDKAADTTTTTATTEGASGEKVLQGYARVVPTGTKIPIIMDTAVDSDTSQEGDEFSARTSEDLSIDGQTLVPAGSIIKGRIASLNNPKHMMRSGSVALKFDTITTPDNRQIPLVANLVAHGGVVHARRGLKDIAIDTAEFTLPSALGLGIGLIAGSKSSSVGTGGGAVIGAGIGAAVGLAILLAKKGKKVDVRPGDELKIELAEDLRMPTL